MWFSVNSNKNHIFYIAIFGTYNITNYYTIKQNNIIFFSVIYNKIFLRPVGYFISYRNSLFLSQ